MLRQPEPSRTQRIILAAGVLAGKRVIGLRSAHHNIPIEGVGLADLYEAIDVLLPKATSPTGYKSPG